MSKQTPVGRRPRPTVLTGWAMVVIALAMVVGALAGRTAWMPLLARVLALLVGVAVFAVGWVIAAARSR